MKLLRLLGIIFFMTLLFKQGVVHAKVQDEPVVKECEYVLSAGGVSDGEFIWTIPYETGSFAKICIETGKKEKLTRHNGFKELEELSGYKTGALHEIEGGGKFLYLAPFDVDRPLARVDLNSLKVDYPFRNVGYYFGSSQITRENGNDFLWLFPSKVRPNGSETEIVKLNLTEGKKEQIILAKIDNNYLAFTNTVKADNVIWLLPSEEGQPLIRMDTASMEDSLESEGAKRIYPGKNMNFSKIISGAFDGNCLWFLSENISFMLNNSVLLKCDQDGNFIERIELTKDRYVKVAANSEEIFLFAGADGKKPFGVTMSIETGEKTQFKLSEKKGYIPYEAVMINGGKSGIYTIPYTKDGKKMPILRVIERPYLKASLVEDGKIYRDYGDLSKGCEVEVAFSTPEGYRPEELIWFVSEEPNEEIESETAFFEKLGSVDSYFRYSEKVKSLNQLTILANRNGNYRFLMKYVSNDNESDIYSMCSQTIDNIYERIPVKITRYDIEEWSDGSIIESVTHLKDFGAALSASGDEFIKLDAPMELFPAREVFANGAFWELKSPASYVISLGDESITPSNYYAEFEFAYQAKKTEALDENIIYDNEWNSVQNMNNSVYKQDDNENYHTLNQISGDQPMQQNSVEITAGEVFPAGYTADGGGDNELYK